MKWRDSVLLAGAGGAMIACSDAAATLVGMVPVLESVAQMTSLGPRDVYRIYAYFTSPLDRVNAWGGGGYLGTATITTGDGSLFTNIGGSAGQIAPSSPGTPRDWDTYMTIGVRWGQEAPGGIDATTQLPSTPPFIIGSSWSIAPSASPAGVYISPEDDQGMAGYRVVGSDTNLLVMLMQLTVNIGTVPVFPMQFSVDWSVDGVPGSGGVVQLTYPAPGGLGVLGVAVLFGPRRRRTA